MASKYFPLHCKILAHASKPMPPEEIRDQIPEKYPGIEEEVSKCTILGLFRCFGGEPERLRRALEANQDLNTLKEELHSLWDEDEAVQGRMPDVITDMFS